MSKRTPWLDFSKSICARYWNPSRKTDTPIKIAMQIPRYCNFPPTITLSIIKPETLGLMTDIADTTRIMESPTIILPLCLPKNEPNHLNEVILRFYNGFKIKSTWIFNNSYSKNFRFKNN